MNAQLAAEHVARVGPSYLYPAQATTPGLVSPAVNTPCGRCRVLATKTRAGRPEGERGRHKDAGVLREHVRRASHPHSGGRHRRRFRACGPSGAAACGAGPDVLGTGAQAGGARARRAFMLTVLRDT